MITLFHSPQTRSTRMLWLLEEFELPYTVEYVSIVRHDGSGQGDPRNPHPDKKVPAIAHNGAVVSESSAICIYLNDLAKNSPVAVSVDDRRRGAFLTWIAYYSGVIEPLVTLGMSGLSDHPAVHRTWRGQAEMAERLLSALRQTPYLTGDRFTAADLLLASVGHFSRKALPADPVIDDFLARINARPALQRGLAKDAA